MVGYIIDSVRLPEDVEQGMQGGPQYRTTVITLDSGHEQANQNWSQTRGVWRVGYGIDGPEVWSEVVAFFRARRGMARGFLFKDWSDYKITAQTFGLGDATTQNFQIYKRYTDTILPFDRVITRPIESTIAITVNDVASVTWTLLTGGIIRFTSAPAIDAVIKITCEFDVPVRFATDLMQVDMTWELAGSVPLFDIMEVRE